MLFHETLRKDYEMEKIGSSDFVLNSEYNESASFWSASAMADAFIGRSVASALLASAVADKAVVQLRFATAILLR